MNHIQSDVYEILPIDNNKSMKHITSGWILMVIVVKMDVVLCDNKHILTHSMS